MLKITPIVCRAGQMDNYAYLLRDEASGIAAVMDPSEAAPVIAECEKQGVVPAYILNTHHHFDHVEGNLELKEKYRAKVVGGMEDCHRIPGFDIGLEDGDIFKLGESEAKIIAADGHTIGHILWYFAKDKALFTGDTLFNLCIGGLFEGTPQQMWHSLQKIRRLPDDVLFYPGHEYTRYGVAETCGNPFLENYAGKAAQRLSAGQPAGPFTLGEEKLCNPYLAADDLDQFCRLLNL